MGGRRKDLPTHEEGRKAIRLAQQAGWRYEQTSSQHWQIWVPGEDVPITFGGTPSNQGLMAAVLAKLNMAGVEAAITARQRDRRAGVRKRRTGENKLPKNLVFDANRFARAVREARTELHWSQTELAEMLGWRPVATRISEIERSGSYPIDAVYDIMRLFDWEDFYGEKLREAPAEPAPAESAPEPVELPAEPAQAPANGLAHRVPRTAAPAPPVEVAPTETVQPRELAPYARIMDAAHELLEAMRLLREDRDRWKTRALTAERELHGVSL